MAVPRLGVILSGFSLKDLAAASNSVLLRADCYNDSMPETKTVRLTETVKAAG